MAPRTCRSARIGWYSAIQAASGASRRVTSAASGRCSSQPGPKAGGSPMSPTGSR